MHVKSPNFFQVVIPFVELVEANWGLEDSPREALASTGVAVVSPLHHLHHLSLLWEDLAHLSLPWVDHPLALMETLRVPLRSWALKESRPWALRATLPFQDGTLPCHRSCEV